nr:LysR family transcriptional regulator [Mycolicibacterium sp.]
MNFSRAAQQVHVIQSALSASVANWKELGVRTIDRSREDTHHPPANSSPGMPVR